MQLPAPQLPIPGFALRPMRPNDATAWHTIVSDPRVYGPTSWPLVSVEELRQKLETLPTDPTAWRWAIVREVDGALVGTCGATRWHDPAGYAEVAYELAPASWRLSLATAAAQGFLNVAKKQGIRIVEAHTWDGNTASGGVLSRVGFHREEWLRAFRSCRGELRNFWRWALVLGP